jgi:hypothetical protein
VLQQFFTVNFSRIMLVRTVLQRPGFALRQFPPAQRIYSERKHLPPAVRL